MVAEIIGTTEVAQGTSDFTTVLEQVRAAKPDVFISAQFGGDAISLLKQCYDMGLNKEMTIFNSFPHQRGGRRVTAGGEREHLRNALLLL